jgi:flagellar basal body-associated protein FliL
MSSVSEELIVPADKPAPSKYKKHKVALVVGVVVLLLLIGGGYAAWVLIGNHGKHDNNIKPMAEMAMSTKTFMSYENDASTSFQQKGQWEIISNEKSGNSFILKLLR